MVLFSYRPRPSQNGQGPFIGQKYKFLKVHFVGTLNLCLKMLGKMQKTRNESDHPGLRKRPNTGEKWPVLISVRKAPRVFKYD